jgi:histidine ammonia-lyase
MGTIAARDCLRIIELTTQVAAAMLLVARQAVALRLRTGARLPSTALTDWHDELSRRIPLIGEDRALDSELRALCAAITAQEFALYPGDRP